MKFLTESTVFCRRKNFCTEKIFLAPERLADITLDLRVWDDKLLDAASSVYYIFNEHKINYGATAEKFITFDHGTTRQNSP